MRVLERIKSDVKQQWTSGLDSMVIVWDWANIVGKVFLCPFIGWVLVYLSAGSILIVFIDVVEPVARFLFKERG